MSIVGRIPLRGLSVPVHLVRLGYAGVRTKAQVRTGFPIPDGSDTPYPPAMS
jgi:hypothetical protein